MAKGKSSFRNSFFFLLGVLVYSFLFWLSGKNHAHAFGALIVVLMGYLIYPRSIGPNINSARVWPRDVVYLCIGVVFDSFSGGFPFNMLSPF
jgi:hypothetical protein